MSRLIYFFINFDLSFFQIVLQNFKYYSALPSKRKSLPRLFCFCFSSGILMIQNGFDSSKTSYFFAMFV